MNTRIKELYLEAGTDTSGRWMSEESAQLFAKLLLKEAMSLCEDVATSADAVSKGTFVTPAGKMLHEGMWGGAKNCASAINIHFGVEE